MAIAQWIGQWAWIIAPWFWVILYDPEWFIDAASGSKQLGIWIGTICMLMAMVPGIFVKSRSTLDDHSLLPITIKNAWNSLLDILRGFKKSNKEFKKLCLATFLVFNSFNTIAAFSFFIIVYYMYNGVASDAGVWPTLFGCIGAVFTAFLTIPTVTAISKRLERKKHS